MVAAYDGKRAAPGLGVLRELVQLHDGRHQRGAARHHPGDQLVVEAGAVLDAVDAGLDQPREHRRAEAVGGDPGAVLVGGGDGGGEGLGRERRGEVALVAGDPVPHQLDPAVAGLGLAGGGRGELARLDLVGVVADVALGPGQVPPAADQPGQVLARLDPPGVGRRAGVPDEQRAGVPVLQRLRPRTPRPARARGRRGRCGSARRPARGRSSPRPPSRRRPAPRG